MGRNTDGPEFWRQAKVDGLTPSQAERRLWWREYGNRFHERPVPVDQFLLSTRNDLAAAAGSRDLAPPSG